MNQPVKYLEELSSSPSQHFLSIKSHHNLLGLFWKLVSCFAFAGVNCIVRYLTGGTGTFSQPLPSEVIVFFQNTFGFLILFPFMFKNGLSTLKTSYPVLHSIRIIIAVLGVISLYYAFANMPMAQAVALQFTGPLFAVIGAKIYLRERMGLSRLLGVFLGLLGAFIITRPDKAFIAPTDTASWLIMLPLFSALAFAGVKILNRKLSLLGESAELLTTYLLFFMVPASLLLALARWTTPTWSSLVFLISLGALGSLAHYAMAKALAYADVTFLTPFGFARIMFTAFLGYVLYAELPTNNNLWIGFGCIMISTIFITLGERDITNRYASKV
jgi:drug/metabolite transporter (DMT)-like permease